METELYASFQHYLVSIIHQQDWYKYKLFNINYSNLKLALFYLKADVPSPQQTLKFDLSISVVTLKVKARSPKPNQAFIMPLSYIHVNLVPTCSLANEISIKSHTDDEGNSHAKKNTIRAPPLQWGVHYNFFKFFFDLAMLSAIR